MRITIKWAVSLLVCLPLMGMGQAAGIDEAINKGSAADLGIYFAKSVDLSIPGKEEVMTADQAVQQLTVFFTRQTVKGYKRVHLSAPQEGRANYSIGDLYTASATYRMYIYYDAQQKISEIRIEK